MAILTLLALGYCCGSAIFADTFGSGANSFNIDFVTIGNPGNPADTTGKPNPAGSVDYIYRMGKYEISRDMINKASAEGGFVITMGDMGFVTGGARDEMPAIDVSWFEAATFVNWLNTSTGRAPAYKFNGGTFLFWEPGDIGYDPNNRFRNSHAYYFLPSADEWYKAAYYDASAGVYYNYPTGSDTAPVAVASGTAAGTAVYNQLSWQGPADITLAGGLSPYGTMAQGGNVIEWEETEFDLVNDSSFSPRGRRGGGWDLAYNFMLSADRISDFPTLVYFDTGFRVARLNVPEPSSLLLVALDGAGLAAAVRRNEGGRIGASEEGGSNVA